MKRINVEILEREWPEMVNKIGDLSLLEAFERGRIDQWEAWYISRILLSYYLQFYLKKSKKKGVVN